jgi:hypothetical protein
MSRRRSGLANHRRQYEYDCSPGIFSILSGPGSPYTSEILTQIDIPGAITDVGTSPLGLDDGLVPIPMGGMNFYFFGTNYLDNLFWGSNNAIIFGSISANTSLNISSGDGQAILLGNYDRVLKTFSYSNKTTSDYSMLTFYVTFYNYFTDTISSPSYQYKIRMIKERNGAQRQFVEVYVISSPPSTGYSTAIVTYPSGATDSNGNTIDPTKNSPYNITEGFNMMATGGSSTSFLNPCGSTFSLTSPPAGTSFVFSSDSTGSTWVFTNNAYVNV